MLLGMRAYACRPGYPGGRDRRISCGSLGNTRISVPEIRQLPILSSTHSVAYIHKTGIHAYMFIIKIKIII